jgi:hypothetical protein
MILVVLALLWALGLTVILCDLDRDRRLLLAEQNPHTRSIA